mmetsp:Transcript_9423/g.38567  ORF Transcript_9423/g.38567 Transcript_9423/m.38567 type:complete len:261 (-) Transcript_9423:1404-2186(-)
MPLDGRLLVLLQSRLQQLLLLRYCAVVEVRVLHLRNVRNHAVGVALVQQELLPLRRVLHLGRVPRNQTVEVRIVLALGPLLGPKNSAEALCLLSARAKVRRDLNEDISLRQVDGVVAHLRDEHHVEIGAVLEALQDLNALVRGRIALEVVVAHGDGVVLERNDAIRENNHLVAARLVVLDQELASAELVWVQDAQVLPEVLVLEVGLVELGRHFAPDLCTADGGNVACLGEVEPVGLVEAGADEVVELLDLVILSHQSRS